LENAFSSVSLIYPMELHTFFDWAIRAAQHRNSRFGRWFVGWMV